MNQAQRAKARKAARNQAANHVRQHEPRKFSASWQIGDVSTAEYRTAKHSKQADSLAHDVYLNRAVKTAIEIRRAAGISGYNHKR